MRSAAFVAKPPPFLVVLCPAGLMAMPFVYAIVTCGTGFFIIAATTLTFSEEKTTDWLIAVRPRP